MSFCTPLAASLLSWAAAGSAPPPIVGGDATGAHDAVGAFVADNGLQSAAFCSGSLISDTRVVTAAHCVEAMIGLDADGYSILFVTGEDVSSSGGIDTITQVTSAVTHPRYSTVPTLMADIAVAVLEERPPGITPLALNEFDPGEDDWPDERIVHVGFGADDDDGTGTGIKRETTLELVGFDGHFIYSEDVHGSNVCMGDSGGAALAEDGMGGQVLVGVNSFAYDPDGGEPRCDGGAAGSTRIDRNLDFIDAVLEGEEVDDGSTWGATTDGDVTTGGGTLPLEDKGGCATVTGLGSTALSMAGLLVLATTRRRRCCLADLSLE